MNRLPPRPTGATRWLVTLGAVAIAFAALGCPGELDPRVAEEKMKMMMGAGGSTGVGGAGGGGGGPAFCDAPGTLFAVQCAIVGCHNPGGVTNAGLDLSAAGLAARLLGQMPTGTNGSVCGSASKPYLVPDSDPAEGLLLDKLFVETQECGLRMPIGVYFDAQEEQCTRDWARGVTTGAITQ